MQHIKLARPDAPLRDRRQPIRREGVAVGDKYVFPILEHQPPHVLPHFAFLKAQHPPEVGADIARRKIHRRKQDENIVGILGEQVEQRLAGADLAVFRVQAPAPAEDH